jgi:ribose transport system substrate-binding protein
MKRTRWIGVAALAMSVAMVAAACGDDDGDDADDAGGGATDSGDDAGATGDDSGDDAAAGGPYTIGVSNTLAGNGWREQMICSIRAEAEARGNVDEVVVISKNGGPTEQIQDLQNLISQGVDAIILNPSDREALNPVIEEAIAQDIVVVAVDQAVTAEGAYVASNDQVAYGRLGMQWLVDELGGEGSVLYMRGIDGVPADTDRDTGVQEVLAENPGIEVKEVFSGWDFTEGANVAVQELTAADYDGIWTSGIDYTVVNAFETVGKEPVPLVGADTNAFIRQLLDGQPGAAVTNPAVIGAVGAGIALDVLAGEDVPQETLLEPEVWDMETAADTLEANYFPDRDETSSSAVTIEGVTNYTPEQLFACGGEG